jgi:glutaredoxin
VSKVISLTLLIKPGCHLCEDAREVVNQAIEEFSKARSTTTQIEFQELNILEDETLLQKHAEEIPVLQINGATHAYWRIEKERLIKALSKLS